MKHISRRARNRIAGTLVASACLAVASVAWATSGNTTTTVYSIMTWTSGGASGVDIVFVDTSTWGTCSKSGIRNKLEIVTTDEQAKRNVSLATSALLAGKNVTVAWNDATKGGPGLVCLVTSITLQAQ